MSAMSKGKQYTFFIAGAFLALGIFLGAYVGGYFSDIGMSWLGLAYPGILGFLGALIMAILCPDIPRKPLALGQPHRYRRARTAGSWSYRFL